MNILIMQNHRLIMDDVLEINNINGWR